MDMNAIGEYISRKIHGNISPENVLLGVIAEFEIPLNHENEFAVNSIRQIIVYHVTQKTNMDLIKLASNESSKFRKKMRKGI